MICETCNVFRFLAEPVLVRLKNKKQKSQKRQDPRANTSYICNNEKNDSPLTCQCNKRKSYVLRSFVHNQIPTLFYFNVDISSEGIFRHWEYHGPQRTAGAQLGAELDQVVFHPRATQTQRIPWTLTDFSILWMRISSFPQILPNGRW